MGQMPVLRCRLACNNLDAPCHTLNAVILITVDRLDRTSAALLIL